MHVLVKVHHLETIKLIRHLFYLLLLARLDDLDSRRVPFDVRAWSRLVLAARLDGAAGNLAVVDVLDAVMTCWTGHDLSCHCERFVPYLFDGIICWQSQLKISKWMKKDVLCLCR